MKNQSEKLRKKEDNIKKSDAAANRLYLLFFAAIALGFGVYKLGNSITAQLYFMDTLKPYVLIVTGALLVFAIIYKFICFKRGKDESFKTFSSSFLLVIAASFFAVTALFGEIFMHDLVILIVIGTVLFFIYNVYDKEFFWYSLYTAVGYLIFDLKFSASLSAPKLVVSSASIILAVAVILAVVLARYRRGKVILFGKPVGKMSEKGNYAFIITSAIIIAATALSLFLAGISPYSIAVLFISYMVFAVIYTLKMI